VGPAPRRLRAATRGSALARWQTDHIATLLRSVHPNVEIEPVIVETTADRRLDIPIAAMGGKGVFVKEVQAAVLDGRAELAVHSAKDLPSTTVEGLLLAGVPLRADPRDALVGTSLADLAPGAHVATGSARRRVQLAHLRPDLRMSGLRGNIATRLGRVGEFDAVVMAKAALDRLELSPPVVDVLDADVLVPQVGQGTLAVECRADDHDLVALLEAITDPDSRRTLDAERAFLAELGGDCNLPAGAHAVADNGRVRLTGVLASTDESVLRRLTLEGADGEATGRELARRLLDEVEASQPLA
jgi:hydroxymethylbilane synthase